MEASESGAGKKFALIPEVQEVHFITGEDCYLLKIRVADNEELAKLLQECVRSMKGVLSVSTSTVLQTYKETAKLPLTTI
jgi:Lrp/AsnC family leucine-responsive transcriptional regulator